MHCRFDAVKAGHLGCAMADDECRVLFVCTGNTCRSPMAEGLFRAAARERGLGEVSVGSAGVAAMDGGAASPETLEVLRQRGLELEGFHSRMGRGLLNRKGNVDRNL